MDQGIRSAKCNKCKNTFTNFALKKHKEQCQGKKSEIDCPECGEIYRSKPAMKKHYDSNHKKEDIRPLEVCMRSKSHSFKLSISSPSKIIFQRIFICRPHNHLRGCILEDLLFLVDQLSAPACMAASSE